MAAAGAILIRRNARIDPETGLPTGFENDDILVNDTMPTYWQWTAHNIDSSLTSIQVQAILDANVALYLSEIVANNETPLTADQVKQIRAEIYARMHLENKVTFLDASLTLENGIFNAGSSPTLATYRTILSNTVSALVPLAGTQFETHFNNERAAQGLPAVSNIPTYTLAQCVALDTLLHVWLSARKIDVLVAESL